MNVLMMTSPAPEKAGFSTGEKRAPLGVAMLMAILEAEGHTVVFDDQYLSPWPIFDTADFLVRHKIDIVGIYSNTICYQGTLGLLRKLQYWRENGAWRGRIAVGGPHTSYGAEKLPEYVDHIVIGEGDITFPRIVAGDVGSRIVVGEKVRDMDAIPIPAWRHMIHKNYNWTSSWIADGPVYTLNTSRGCPFSCTFCSVKGVWGRTYRHMGSERVVSEVKHLIKHYGMRVAYFREDHFTLSEKRTVEFCEHLLRENINISWMCESRADSIEDEGLMRLMARAGCKALYIGVESGSPAMLERLRKNETVDQFRHVFASARKCGIKTYASMVYGIPGETEEDISASEALLRDISPDAIGRNVFVAIPGSQLYDAVRQSGDYDYEDANGILYPAGYERRVRKYYKSYDGFLVVSSALGAGGRTGETPRVRKRPKISVLMPVRNCSAFVVEAISSVLSQTYNDFELMVVDDASDDDTLEAVMSVRDPRIVVMRNAERKGLTRTLNELLPEVRGDFVARMDGDDLSVPQRFEVQLKALEENKALWVVGGSYRFIGSRDGMRVLPTAHDILKARCFFDNPLPHPFVMWRAESFRSAGITYDEHMTCAQDYELWMRLMHEHESARLGNVPYSIGSYRVHPQSISIGRNVEQSGLSKMVRKKYLKLLGFDEGYTRWDIYDAMVDGFVSSSREYIRGVKAFLMDLRTANAQFKVYCDIPWRMSCVEKMQSICLQHLHLGPWVCKELFTHPDFQMLNVEKSEMERILEAASHALKTVE